jgi:hypothetical protein
LAIGGASKLIGLPFDEDSYINKLSKESLEAPKNSLKLFNEIPDKLNTKITGMELHYKVYDLEIIKWSDKSETRRMFNVRPVKE